MTPEQAVEEAMTIVNGARQSDYGTPALNHGATADMWNTFIKRKSGADPGLSALDVCDMNILQKISRAANNYKEDNEVDKIGYTLNRLMIVEAEKKDQAVEATHIDPFTDAQRARLGWEIESQNDCLLDQRRSRSIVRELDAASKDMRNATQ